MPSDASATKITVDVAALAAEIRELVGSSVEDDRRLRRAVALCLPRTRSRRVRGNTGSEDERLVRLTSATRVLFRSCRRALTVQAH